MSSRAFILITLAALTGIAAFAYLSGGRAHERRAVETAKAVAVKAKPQAAPAAPAAAPAAAESTATTSTTAVASSDASPAPAEAAAAPASPAKAIDVSAFYGKKFRIGAPNLKKVALTFDDGPYAQTTPQVLEILKKENIRATFFMLGQSVRKYPDVARMVAEAGHEIGCHTDNHQNLKGKSAESIHHEVVETAEYIAKATGRQPHVFRPPYGTYNATVLKNCAEGGMVMVTWSVDPDDWRKGSTSQTIFSTVMKQTTNGAVILMHDTHEKTIGALPLVIKELRSRGYQFVTVGEMIAETAAQPPELLARVAEAEPQPPARPVSIPLSKSGM